MAKHDRYQCSARVGTDLQTAAHWTPMWDVPRGKSAVAEAQETIAELQTVTQVAIYRNRRFMRYVYAPPKLACA